MSLRPDLDEIKRAAAILFEPGQVVELRTTKPLSSGYYNDPTKLAKAAEALSQQPNVSGVYWTIQELKPDLLARAANRLREYVSNGDTTADNGITRYRWLPVDIDPERVSGISATEEEKAAARDVADGLRKFLSDRGIATVLVDSGNGYQILARINLPNDAEGVDLVRRVLKALAQQFDTSTAHVDCGVYNPARILKVPGTLARKGSNLPKRPHRLSRIIDAPADLPVVSKDELEKIAGNADTQAGEHDTASLAAKADWLEGIFQQASIAYMPRQTYKDGFKWQLKECPFGGHPGPDSVVFLYANGATGFHCSHNSCEPYRWKDFKAFAEQRGAIFTRKFAQSDVGNAAFFHHFADDSVRFDFGRGRWLLWNKTRQRWEVDKTSQIVEMAKAAVAERKRQAFEMPNPDGDSPEEKEAKRERAAELRWCFESESASKLANMLGLAKSMYGISDDGKSWDQDSWLLGVENGLIDLRTETFRARTRADLILKSTGIVYDPDAKCPRWEKFFEEIFPNDPQTCLFVQKLWGYGLTGDTRERKVFCFTGAGNNGKSAMIKTGHAVLGDYFSTEDFAFLDGRKDSKGYGASLPGCRLVETSEPSENLRLNLGLLKRLSGCDKGTLRLCNRDAFEYEPQFKLLLVCNEKPTIRSNDPAVWGRFKVVPFAQEFRADREDKGLYEKLQAEGSGILNWMLRGCALWQQEGLGSSPAIDIATREYREESHPLRDFIEETFAIGKSHQCQNSVVKSCYADFCRSRGLTPLSQKAFKTEMKALGFNDGHDKTRSSRVWHGLKHTAAIGARDEGDLGPIDPPQEQVGGQSNAAVLN